MAKDTGGIVLTMDDLREVTGYAAACAQDVLEIYEGAHPADSRPRDAIDAAWTFARGGKRGKTLRDTAWAALKAAGEADTAAVGNAARAALSAASAAYLHPLADPHQVKHILGAAAHAARAAELLADDDPSVGADHLERARRRATPTVVDVLSRYPAAPPGGGRFGELLRDLETSSKPIARPFARGSVSSTPGGRPRGNGDGPVLHPALRLAHARPCMGDGGPRPVQRILTPLGNLTLPVSLRSHDRPAAPLTTGGMMTDHMHDATDAWRHRP